MSVGSLIGIPKTKSWMRNKWLAAFAIMSLMTGTSLVGVRAQSVTRIASLASDEDLKSEVSLCVGSAIPMGASRSFLSIEPGESGPVPRGAKPGGAVWVGYRYFFLPQLSLGTSFTGQWYGYDYRAFQLGSATRIEHLGWGIYGLTADIGTRLPLGLYGLYFTASVQCGYALVCTPSVKAIYSSLTVGDIERRILESSLQGKFYLSGGIGIQYRFRRHWLCHLNFNYGYMPATGLGSDQTPLREENSGMTLNLSSFFVSVGASYAF